MDRFFAAGLIPDAAIPGVITDVRSFAADIPIVMTALAFIVGCLPLWTAAGSGAASRRILGTVVVGGMTLSTALGIIFIPVTFAVVEYLSHRFARGGRSTTMDSSHGLCGPPAPEPEPSIAQAEGVEA